MNRAIKSILCCICILVSVQLFAQTNTNKNTALIQQVKNFYNWYKQNYTQHNAFKLYKGNGEDDAPPYTIQWTEVEKYFTFIRTKVPALGEAFIEWHRSDFKRIAEIFKKYPTEEIAIGFDYDRIIGGQEEMEEIIDYSFPRNGKWEVSIKGNTAIVACIYEAIDYETDRIIEARSETELKKEKGIWKISKTLGMMELEALRKEKLKDVGNTI